MSVHRIVSPFEQGQSAGKDLQGEWVANPFMKGSAEHNNFEVGRRFGAAHSKPVAEALIPDKDEEDSFSEEN